MHRYWGFQEKRQYNVAKGGWLVRWNFFFNRLVQRANQPPSWQPCSLDLRKERDHSLRNKVRKCCWIIVKFLRRVMAWCRMRRKTWLSEVLSECVLLIWAQPWRGPRPLNHGLKLAKAFPYVCQTWSWQSLLSLVQVRVFMIDQCVQKNSSCIFLLQDGYCLKLFRL